MTKKHGLTLFLAAVIVIAMGLPYSGFVWDAVAQYTDSSNDATNTSTGTSPSTSPSAQSNAPSSFIINTNNADLTLFNVTQASNNFIDIYGNCGGTNNCSLLYRLEGNNLPDTGFFFSQLVNNGKGISLVTMRIDVIDAASNIYQVTAFVDGMWDKAFIFSVSDTGSLNLTTVLK